MPGKTAGEVLWELLRLPNENTNYVQVVVDREYCRVGVRSNLLFEIRSPR